jgi:hypothetical protein
MRRRRPRAPTLFHWEIRLNRAPGSDDRVRDRVRESPYHGHGPSGGYVQAARDPHPSSLERTVPHRGVATPSVPLRRVAESNNLRAIDSVVRQDTNSLPPT